MLMIRNYPSMKLSSKIILFLLMFAAVTGVFIGLTHGHTFDVLSPEGVIASKERTLILTATALMLIVVIPVFVLTFTIAWRYRADNTAAKYTPDWDHNNWLEAIWWGLPCLIILAVSVLAWNSSHELDPYRQIDSTTKPITIEVVALPWKWLFIYPEQHIATVNMVEFPAQTPVNFLITSDAPMNSFWIPQLGGQIYAMPGMSTQLSLMADHKGTYQGSSANLSGSGFAGMRFTANSTSQADFDQWVSSVKQSASPLTLSDYDNLAAPSKNTPVSYFSSPAFGLYNHVVMKYMSPDMNMDMSGMEMQ